ncbi:MAG: acyloxyacyl hydrolase [Bacteroidota bacterium]
MVLVQNTISAQHAISVQRVQGNMVSHSINNASMAGRVGGWQLQSEWKLSADPRAALKPRYVGLLVYGFDMGDAHRKTAYSDSLGPVNDGLYARGGQVFSFGGLVGQDVHLSPHLNFRYQWSTGVSYHTEFFDSVSNPKNLAISTPINFAGQLRFDLIKKVSDCSDVQLGMGISHFSNANFRKPNVGYNIIYGSLAWRYRLNSTTTKQASYSRYQTIQGAGKQLGFRLGYRMYSMKVPVYFPVIVGEWNHKIGSQRGSNSASTELHEWRYGINVFGELPHADIRLKGEVGAFARHVFRMGRFDLLLDLGVYLHKPQPQKTQFYNCLGFQCHLSDRWIFQQRLKAHINNADYLEWGLIYSLPN